MTESGVGSRESEVGSRSLPTDGLTGLPTRKIRIAHLADTHLGYSAYGKADPESGRNQRAVDIEDSFAAAISDILTRDVDLYRALSTSHENHLGVYASVREPGTISAGDTITLT